MVTINKAISNLSDAITCTLPKDCFLTLEIGVSLDGIKTMTAAILSGDSSSNISYCSMTGVIDNDRHEITRFDNAINITRAVLVAFRELMFSVNSLLNDRELKAIRNAQNMVAFNALIKPWSVEITHISDEKLVRAERIKDSAEMSVSGGGKVLAQFKIGSAINAQQSAYELLSSSLLLSSVATAKADNRTISSC